MTLQAISIEATGVNLAFSLNTDDLAKIFGTTRAININWMQCSPLTLGTAIEIHIVADHDQKIDESSGDKTTISFNDMKVITLILGSDGSIVESHDPGSETFFRFTTVDVSPQMKPFSTFPVFNNLIIGWSADVDFVLEFDYTELDQPWDFREEIMDLLANKGTVEDPNISNVDGKRSLVRNPMLLTNE